MQRYNNTAAEPTQSPHSANVAAGVGVAAFVGGLLFGGYAVSAWWTGWLPTPALFAVLTVATGCIVGGALAAWRGAFDDLIDLSEHAALRADYAAAVATIAEQDAIIAELRGQVDRIAVHDRNGVHYVDRLPGVPSDARRWLRDNLYPAGKLTNVYETGQIAVAFPFTRKRNPQAWAALEARGMVEEFLGGIRWNGPQTWAELEPRL